VPETPYLYKVVSIVSNNGAATDEYSTTFGIRTFYFDANKGFFLNNKHYKLNGFCNHDDYAGLGCAIPKRIHYQNIKQMADAGYIWLRAAHNLRSVEELDACDTYGVMVWDETRYFRNGAIELQSMRDQVRRDRNHPSVIIWSIGNEEPMQGTSSGTTVANALRSASCRTIRPVLSPWQ